jgi:hypothetical protein
MAKAHLTEFLLKLATDSAMLEKYQKGNKREREALMKKGKLTPQQRKTVLSANTQKLTDEIEKELKNEGAVPQGSGNHLYVQLYVQLPG